MSNLDTIRDGAAGRRCGGSGAGRDLVGAHLLGALIVAFGGESSYAGVSYERMRWQILARPVAAAFTKTSDVDAPTRGALGEFGQNVLGRAHHGRSHTVKAVRPHSGWGGNSRATVACRLPMGPGDATSRQLENSAESGGVFEALGDRNRRHILSLLAEEAMPVRDIAAALPISRPAVSRHLRLLKQAGLVVEQPHGTRRIYRLQDQGMQAAQAYLEQVWGQAAVRFRLLAENTGPRPER